MKQLQLEITGKVQGVFYRANTKQKAEQLGIKGWVKNTPEGTVKVLAQGPESALLKLKEWCHQGPPTAQVDQIKAEWQDSTKNLKSFEIKY